MISVEEAKKRAKEAAELAGCGPEETAALVAQAARWAGLDAMGLDAEIKASHLAAQNEPRTPILGARQLLATYMRETAVMEGIEDPEAAAAYERRNLRGFALDGAVGYGSGPSGAMFQPQNLKIAHVPEPTDAERAAATSAETKAAQIAELRKHPAMYDERHPEHDAVVQQLKEATRTAYGIEE